jgi:hypothetical protein
VNKGLPRNRRSCKFLDHHGSIRVTGTNYLYRLVLPLLHPHCVFQLTAAASGRPLSQIFLVLEMWLFLYFFYFHHLSIHPLKMPIVFTQPIDYGADLLHSQPKPPGINLATYNIQDGQGREGESGLILALSALQLANIELAILTETKISTDVYSKHRMGYDVIFTKSIPHQGGLALVTKASDGWH